IENEYALPSPVGVLSSPTADLLIRWLGARNVTRLANSAFLRQLPTPIFTRLRQRSEYMRELYQLPRRHGITVPIFHNDVHPLRGRQLDVDLMALDHYPVTTFARDWRDDPNTFREFERHELSPAAHGRAQNPIFYPELQAGWYDGWGGVGYD